MRKIIIQTVLRHYFKAPNSSTFYQFLESKESEGIFVESIKIWFDKKIKLWKK